MGGVYRDAKIRYFYYTVKINFTEFWDFFRLISRNFGLILGGVFKLLVPQKLRFGPYLGEGGVWYERHGMLTFLESYGF